MIIKFKAFANYRNGENARTRVDVAVCETEEKALDAAEKYAQENEGTDYIGVHKYYVIPEKEWDDMAYTSTSIRDGKTKTWMTNEGKGCVLLFEGLHFEIVA